MALYFPDFTAGQEFMTPARTVTESDVASFAAWTGDYNPVHTDAEFARRTRFGERIAHGALGISLCLGLLSRTGVFDGSAVALLGVDEWRFRAPIRIGDTVHCRVTIVGTYPTKAGDTGIVQRRFELRNHRGAILQDGRMDVMVYVEVPRAVESSCEGDAVVDRSSRHRGTESSTAAQASPEPEGAGHCIDGRQKSDVPARDDTRSR